MRIRTVIVALMVIAAGLIGWRVLAPRMGQPPQAPTTANTTAPAGSDYYMRDAMIYQMGINGRRTYRIHVDELLHYPDDSARLHTIHGRYEAGSETWWTLDAANGRVPPGSRDIFLMGGVVLHHPRPDGDVVVINTDHAWVRTQKNIIETKAHATAVSPSRKAEGDGLLVTLDNDRVKLLNNARVSYVQP